MRIVYDLKNEEMNRVASIEIITIKNNIPKYEPLDLTKFYTCVTNSYMANGGDGFDIISKYKTNHT